MRAYKFPSDYRGQDLIDRERMQILTILQIFTYWASKASFAENKVFTYNKGMIAILQRLLSIMEEEDAFWVLIGLIKNMGNFLSFDYKQPEGQDYDQY